MPCCGLVLLPPAAGRNRNAQSRDRGVDAPRLPPSSGSNSHATQGPRMDKPINTLFHKGAPLETQENTY